jgi:hypothetical protein
MPNLPWLNFIFKFTPGHYRAGVLFVPGFIVWGTAAWLTSKLFYNPNLTTFLLLALWTLVVMWLSATLHDWGQVRFSMCICTCLPFIAITLFYCSKLQNYA